MISTLLEPKMCLDKRGALQFALIVMMIKKIFFYQNTI